MPSNTHIVTKEQQEIFDYKPLGMLITAPAGCGKTEALAYRAKGLLERFNFSGNGRRLLIVSFTNQARDNISERLKKYISMQTLREHVTVCNFHGLASRIIKAHGYLVGIGNDWTVANVDWAGREIRSRGYGRDINDQATSALRDAKLTCLTDDDVKRQLEGVDGQIGQIVLSVEKKRISEKVVSYDDQIRIALWLLRDQRVASLYRNHFFAALVDEFQDLTPQQLQFVQALCGDSITYAGDLAQSIFAFTGADARYTQQEISKSIKKQIKLVKSFRSAPAILNTVNALSPLTGSENLAAAFPTHWGTGGVSALASFKNENDEATWVIGMSQSILQHCPGQRIGIIARTGFRTNGVKQTLSKGGISFTDWGTGTFRPEAARVLRNICSDLQSKSFESSLEIYHYIRHKVAVNQESPIEELEEACAWLFDQLLQRNADLSKLHEVKEKISERRGNETIATRGGIHCLTGHAGKGQQFDWVFVLGLEEGTIPYYKAKSAEEKSEEARVLSVMISRARIGVFGTCVQVDSRNFNKRPSEFVQYLVKTPGVLRGKSNIMSWCSKADWPAIAQM